MAAEKSQFVRRSIELGLFLLANWQVIAVVAAAVVIVAVVSATTRSCEYSSIKRTGANANAAAANSALLDAEREQLRRGADSDLFQLERERLKQNENFNLAVRDLDRDIDTNRRVTGSELDAAAAEYRRHAANVNAGRQK